MLGGGGGTNGNSIFPGFVGENSVQYVNNSLPQLQLFERVNYSGSGHMLDDNFPVNRVTEGESFPFQQTVHKSLNNVSCREETGGHFGNVLNPNPVSTGLKLSCNVEEHNSSVSFACENTRSNPAPTVSMANAAQVEIDRHTQEFIRYTHIQEENILTGVREINQRHMVSLLNALEKGINKKLHEKEVEIESMNRKNKELGDRIKQVTMEAQSWHCKAKYNESVANSLKSNIQHLMAQRALQAREGCGDSEVDDAVSCSLGNQGLQNHRPPKCSVCHGKVVSVLFLPCRHLCLCTDCEGLVDVCPVCRVMKTASVHVFM